MIIEKAIPNCSERGRWFSVKNTMKLEAGSLWLPKATWTRQIMVNPQPLLERDATGGKSRLTVVG